MVARHNQHLAKLKSKAAQGNMKRLTMDYEEADLHRFKAKVGSKGLKMCDVMRQWVKDYIK